MWPVTLAAMLPLLLAAAVAAPTAPVPIAPLGSLINTSDYPEAARRRRASGRVGFRLRIDASGKPDGCVVWQTSGAADLDHATCDLLLARAHFVPAHDARGELVRGDYAGRIAWTIEETPEPVASELVAIRDVVDDTGAIASCTIMPPDAATDLGGCDSFGDGRWAQRLIGQPLTGLAWFEMRMIKQDPTQPSIDTPVPPGAAKRLIAQSTMTIAPTGAIADCKDDVVSPFDDRPLALCAVGRADPAYTFAPSNSPAPRLLVVSVEMVTQKR